MVEVEGVNGWHYVEWSPFICCLPPPFSCYIVAQVDFSITLFSHILTGSNWNWSGLSFFICFSLSFFSFPIAMVGVGPST